MLDDVVDTCNELALIYKVSPYSFYDRPLMEVRRVYEATMATLERVRPNRED